MFKSIFTKLLVTYLAIITAVIGVLSLVLSLAYSDYIFSQKHKTLITAASKVNQLVNAYYQGKTSKQELDTALSSIGYITDAKVYVMKVDGEALKDPSLKLGEGLEEDYLVHDLGKVLEDRVVFRKNQYSNKFDTYMVFTGVPLKVDSKIEGAILFFSPVSQVSSDIGKINLIIWITAFAAIVISAAVIYINSSRISRPIREMEHAARKLAMGEDTEDLEIKTKDEIGKLAETFNYMKVQLVNTETIRREFIASVSHDLRTPLTSIKGFVQGMLDGIVKPEDSGKYLNIIKEETLRLIKLTGDILELAKIQSGSIRLVKERLNAGQLLEDAAGSVGSLAGERGIRLTVNCPEDIEVYADGDRLKQVLINLISNAVKYNRGEGSVFVKADDTPGNIEFSVRDTGIGIPARELPFIFEKFYRVDKSRQSSHGGTGLGLNIAKSLVELHGGRIWAKSEEGLGTEMIFQIPK